ncbi:hypothetical protein CLH62_01720 [Marinobacter guineae]|uniref:Uncharacterized protein n=2 Tax=Marinobacter guineae TaxID=432303 RepID=A0A2G1VHT4_9GAMM|nr:hypothetical protein CLH62_01720 [Marinobacter guineae]
MRKFMEFWICPYNYDAAFRHYEELEGILSPSELAKLKSFRVEDNQLQFLVSRYLLKTGLSDFLGVDPEDLVFRRAPSGKPGLAIPGHRGLAVDFSLSYTQGMAVLLIRPGQTKCGIDVERFENINVDDFLSSRFFSQRERKWILGGRTPLTIGRRFFLSWTMKEAYLKATGEGLAGLSREIEVVIGNSGNYVLDQRPPNQQLKQMRFHDTFIDDQFQVALAWESASPDLEIRQKRISRFAMLNK